MSYLEVLQEKIQETLSGKIQSCEIAYGELTIILRLEYLLAVAKLLRDDPALSFEMLMDLCGVDYLHYGLSEWTTDTATKTGFSRGVQKEAVSEVLRENKPRFAVVYHLLSIKHNHRCRLKVFVNEAELKVPSIVAIWNSANWYEREAFDLFGIVFEGHPDLRRLLTDYGFVGHPFRKDFPLSGTVEMRYSAKEQRVIYEPVDIEPRTLVPKTIRSDHRYLKADKGSTSHV